MVNNAAKLVNPRPSYFDEYTAAGRDSVTRYPAISPVNATSNGVTACANDGDEPLEIKVSARHAIALREISGVARYLTPNVLQGTVKQLGNLFNLDVDEQEEIDLPDSRSLKSFARLIAFFKPTVRPLLGVKRSGDILIMWSEGDGQLSFEIGPNDRVKWFVHRTFNGISESALGQTEVIRLAPLIQAHGMREFLDGEG